VVGVETNPRASSARKVGVVTAGHSSVMEDGRAPPAARIGPAAGAGLRARQAGPRLRRHVERRARLYQPVGQGRAGDRRRHRPVCRLRPARRHPDPRAHARGHPRAVPDVQPHAHAAPVGRHRRRHPRPQPDHRQDAGRRPLCQLRLGHRRLQGDAGLGHVFAHTLARASRTRSTRLLAGPLQERPADRRAALPPWRTERESHAADRLPPLRPPGRDRVPLRRRGAHRPAGRRRRVPESDGWRDYLFTAKARRASSSSAGTMPMAASAGSTWRATR
jgi:hypothetical protein